MVIRMDNDQLLNQIQVLLEGMETRINERFEPRLDAIDLRLDGIDLRLDSIDRKLTLHVEHQAEWKEMRRA